MSRFYLRCTNKPGTSGPAFYVHWDREDDEWRIWCSLKGAKTWTTAARAAEALPSIAHELRIAGWLEPEERLEVYEHVPTERPRTGMDELNNLLRLR